MTTSRFAREIAQFGRNATLNKVQFKRFETQDIEGKVHKIATPRHWLSPEMAKLIMNPVEVVSTEQNDLRRASKWWGVYHTACTQTTAPKQLVSPAPSFFGMPPGMLPEYFRTQHYSHSYLWDQQAMDGRAWEVVLERSVADNDVWVDVMAIMGRGVPEKSTEQQLTMRRGIEWEEPRQDAVNGFAAESLAAFCLNATIDLALRGQPADVLLG